MENTQRGYAEIKHDGRLWRFKFGMNAMSFLAEELTTDGKMLEFSEVANAVDIANVHIVRKLLYCGAKAGALEAGEEVDFNEYKVMSLFDELTDEAVAPIHRAIENARIHGKTMKEIFGEIQKESDKKKQKA